MESNQLRQKKLQLKKLIGERVRIAREDAGFKSQDSLAEAVGISRQAVCAIEGGKSVPGSDTLFLIAEKTRKPIEFFFPTVEITQLLTPERIEQKLDRILKFLSAWPHEAK